jgi:hypothetical protein
MRELSCHDLMKLITGIQNWVVLNMPEELLVQTGLEPVTYAHARAHLELLQGIPE